MFQYYKLYLLTALFAGSFFIMPGEGIVLSTANAQDNSAEKLLLEAEKEQYKFDRQVREEEWVRVQNKWAQTLSEVGQFVSGDDGFNQDNVERSLYNIDRLVSEAKTLIKKADEVLRTNQFLLQGLGVEAPAAEPEKLTVTRNQLNLTRQFYTEQLKKLNQLTTNAENLKLAVSLYERNEVIDMVTIKAPLPYLPSTISAAVKSISDKLLSIASSIKQWLKDHSHSSKAWTAAASIFAGFLFAYYLGKLIGRKCGRIPDEMAPANSRKIYAAIAEGVSTGLIPVTFIGVMYALFNSIYAPQSAQLSADINSLLIHLFILAVSLTLFYAILSPNYPQWRLTSLNASASSRIGKALAFLLIVVVGTHYLFDFLHIDPASAAHFTEAENRTSSLINALSTTLKALGLIYLCQSSIWAPERREIDDEEASALDTIGFLLRALIILISITAIAVSLVGYVYLGGYLTIGVIYSLFILIAAYFTHQAVHDLVGYTVKQQWFRQGLNLRIIQLQSIKFWAGFILDPIIVIAALMMIMPFWGVPVEKFVQWLKLAFDGFNIGELRISLKGILLSIVVFVALMKLTRFTQKFVKQNIFPKSSQDTASQHNTLTIINYLGVLIALGSAIAALGIDFQTIALIMGALSVGIGFGLRNVVSNFVSGLLLLIEKPIKVGDWIQIGAHEGFVKDLKFRSTELQTFQQASVIIPNADLISQPVINMTFADQVGRIEIPVGVSYASDPLLVHNLLVDIAEEHPEVSKDPGPQVMFMNFGDSALEFELRCFTNNIVNKVLTASELRFQIERVLRENKIEIPFPQRVVHVQHSGDIAADSQNQDHKE